MTLPKLPSRNYPPYYNESGMENEELYIEDEPDPATCQHNWITRHIEGDTFYLCAKCNSIITASEYEAGLDDIPY